MTQNVANSITSCKPDSANRPGYRGWWIGTSLPQACGLRFVLGLIIPVGLLIWGFIDYVL